jgi:hypothetical protein
MSRSWKKPWIKDKTNLNYSKIIRSRINQIVRSILKKDPEEVVLPNPKTIINDYDISDYRFKLENKKQIRK